ncbi:helix-turn-helix domain-containing protein [Leifsonia sp. NPDC058194]|uniref:helix-turn-helix domain-containing protein n=1 Tax=Leifsonia sp. NPDC058194 TaxID=3346374 RepID=UPI0036DF044E
MAQRETTGIRRTLVSSPRLRLLDLLQQESPQTATRLAAAVDLHHNTVREHLERLIDDGLVVRASEHRTVRGRPQIFYSAATGLDGASERARTQTGDAIALGRAYRRAFPDTLPDAAGGGDDRAREAADAQLDVLEDYLDRCGFEPRVDRAALEIRLCCPFGDLRSELAESLCSVDRRVVCSVLARVDGPLDVTGITPTEAAGTCVLTMERRA